jgi:hypothetical protein
MRGEAVLLGGQEPPDRRLRGVHLPHGVLVEIVTK